MYKRNSLIIAYEKGESRIDGIVTYRRNRAEMPVYFYFIEKCQTYPITMYHLHKKNIKERTDKHE